jgi:outer membrane lipoprotein-sorting protein
VKRLAPIAALYLFGGLFSLHAEALEDLLARMDRAAQEFRSLSAKMKRMQYTAVIDEKSETEGAMRIRRAKAGTVGIVEFPAPDERTVFIAGKTAQIYYPKANTVEIYDTSKYVSNIDQFLLLGFGTTSAELNKAYTIRAAGTEMIGSVAATKLELTPKSAELKKLIAKIELWIPEGQSNPVQEKLTEPSKNYELINYLDIKVNPPLPDSAFELKLPSGVKKVYPQK